MAKTNLIAPGNDRRIKTYILEGANIFEGVRARLGTDIIYAHLPNQSIEKAAARIQGPANIILYAHGTQDGRFEWRENEFLPYEQLFKELPRNGILSITIVSCFGGKALEEKVLRAAPPGALVLTLTGPSTVNWDVNYDAIFHEIRGMTNPIDFSIKSYDNFPVDVIKHFSRRWGYSNPEASIPQVIGIGGEPPKRIVLNETWGDLKGKLDTPEFKEALVKVKKLFDAKRYRIKKEGNSSNTVGYAYSTSEKESQQAIEYQIDEVAGELSQGKKPKGIEKMLVSNAIAIAYLEGTGELTRIISNQKNYVAPDFTYRDAFGKPIDEKEPLHRATGIFRKFWDSYYQDLEQKNAARGITHDEQAYINSVVKRLEQSDVEEKVRDKLLKDLVKTFRVSSGTDLIKHGLSEDLKKSGISTDGWRER